MGENEEKESEEENDRSRPRLAELRGVDEVYGPAEDSHLLVEAALERVEPGSLVLDVGTGSGYVGGRIQEERDARVVGVDLNPAACEAARGRGLDVIRGDLVSAFRDGSFDLACFNPPYLPEPPAGGWNDWMERALTGGEDGREVVGRFLEDVGRVLADDGEVFLVISTLTGPDAVRSAARKHGLDSEVVAEESHPFEKLFVFRLVADR